MRSEQSLCMIDRILGELTSLTGMDPESIGTDQLRVTVRRLLAESGWKEEDFGTFDGFMASLREKLIEATIVSETWFFRDIAPFAFLKKMLQGRPGWQPKILCVPCATGEEAWSVAAVLYGLGYRENGIVTAGDICSGSVEHARDGWYRASAFRDGGGPPDDYNNCFIPKDGGFRVADELRELVFFEQCNILDESWLETQPQYDIVFCRNLRIYLTKRHGDLLYAHLDRLLKTNGTLFLGHAETAPAALFQRADSPFAFAWRKGEKGIVDEPVQNGKPAGPRRERGSELSKRSAPFIPTIHDIRGYADLGDYRKALQGLQERRWDDDNPEYFYLKASVQLAMGNDFAAMESLRKTLYLDPGHKEARLQYDLLKRTGKRAKSPVKDGNDGI